MIKHKQQQKSHPNNEDSGFTIIESLVAMIVAAVLLSAIAPVLVMSTATRVQARRIELGTQAAKTFIDAVRSSSIKSSDIKTVSTLEPPTSDKPRNLTATPVDYLVNTTKMPAPTSADDLYCLTDGFINKPADCSSLKKINFYVQAGRIVQTTGDNDGYRLAIRVYRGDVEFGNSSKPLLVSEGTTKSKATTVTSGIGNKQAPIVEMTTDISNSSTSFQALCQRLGAAPGKTCQ